MRKISIFNRTGLPHDTTIKDEETGIHLTRCTQEVSLRIAPQDVVTAQVTLSLVGTDIEGANAHFFMRHPQTGDLLEVKSITLADGSVLEF